MIPSLTNERILNMNTTFKDLIDLLRKKRLHIATAESLTGGLAASMFVDVPGASKAFKEAFVTYCDEAKIHTLNVSSETIKEHGAISEKTAREMAIGAALLSGADIAISFTGNAGPDPDEGKPVGLVYIGLYICGDVQTFECHFEGDRSSIRFESALTGASLCLKALSS